MTRSPRLLAGLWLAVATMAVACGPRLGQAQYLSSARTGVVIPAGFASASAGSAGIIPAVPRMSDEKDPLLAGVLSFVVPGVGSFYAGNTRHGWTHLLIHAASYALLVSSATSTTNGKSAAGTAGLGVAALLVNNVWSIFTAVSDAKATRPGGSGSDAADAPSSSSTSP